jgi:UDP-2-acetamido-3-amino-2,3-dideoxy-glucuronate N-acetyltransferase
LRRQVDPIARVADDAVLADDCIVAAGAYVGRRTCIEPGATVGPHAVLLDAAADGSGVVLRRGAAVGANATIYPGVTIGSHAVVRPGAVVARSVPPGAIVEGHPAAIVGYVDTQAAPVAALTVPSRREATVESLPVAGVTLHHFPVVPDLRGNLTIGEFDQQVPFMPQRYFMVYGVPNREIRGEHAHRECHQFLICVRGNCAVVADDGRSRVETVLDAPHRGLYLPPMTWGIQYKYTADAMLLVFASHAYDPADYIREYDAFLREVAR